MNITVYTKPACVQCNATYRALDKQGHRVREGRHHPGSEALDYVMALGTCRPRSWSPTKTTGRASVPTRSSELGDCLAGGPIHRAATAFGGSRKESSHDEHELVYFSSVSGNTHRFVEKLGLPAHPDSAARCIEADEPYVLVVPTYGGGAATDAGASTQAGHRVPERRAQPRADPRRHRRGQHQLRCERYASPATSSPRSAACRTCTASKSWEPRDDVHAVDEGLDAFW